MAFCLFVSVPQRPAAVYQQYTSLIFQTFPLSISFHFLKDSVFGVIIIYAYIVLSA